VTTSRTGAVRIIFAMGAFVIGWCLGGCAGSSGLPGPNHVFVQSQAQGAPS